MKRDLKVVRKLPPLPPPEGEPWSEVKLRAAVILVACAGAAGAIILLKMFGIIP